jgi:predicted RecA/RadA family phage recombinase
VKNYVEPGEVLPFTAPAGGVVAGSFYLIGAVLVVATVTADVGTLFSAYVGPGVVSGAKAAGQAWTEGAKVYWDNAAKNFTATGSGNTLVGIAAASAASADTSGYVRLDGVAR